MKKILFLLLVVTLFLTACGENKETSTPVNKDTETKEEKSSEPAQEELNDKLKTEAVQAVFVDLNSDEAEVGKKVFATGEVSNIKEDGIFMTFTLTVKESEGVGMYSVTDVLKETDYNEGDSIKVFGSYDGKDDLGFPKINSTVIEKQ